MSSSCFLHALTATTKQSPHYNRAFAPRISTTAKSILALPYASYYSWHSPNTRRSPAHNTLPSRSSAPRSSQTPNRTSLNARSVCHSRKRE
ncbi:hypothetical protein BDV96DRAFT_573623 [Lophiotrema nucula]|uniref:Uncharacterized protein n=1 Tax=Lophiotrema nucula TaxID=690887 RepID=A0A6A5ZBZ0_9PLEO|nr:hypothetical protein BDV96DRAFT_573623 [Lophiotrema nucula]